MSKYAYLAQFPDATGQVGQFVMRNEPSLHIPYLYNYAGQPWKTQNKQNKYVQKATLNGKELESPWFSWEEIKNGGELVLEMGDRPNYKMWTEGRAE